jgi:uncharacterized protein (DUF305 family)
MMMIPHHEGAIEMAKLAQQRATRPEVKELAGQIITAQQQEISRMRTLYRQWFGGAVPEMPAGGMMMGGMDMMSGMGNDLRRLRQARDFDREFLAQMIPHHGMALMMADSVRINGQRPQLRQMARQMIADQAREIGQMQAWRAEWFPPIG